MKKLLAILLILVLVLSLVACGGNDVASGTPDSGNSSEDSNNNNSDDKNNESNDSAVKSYSEMPSGLTAVKIGSVSPNSVSGANDGICYHNNENKKYGIMSFDGKKDTGPKYTRCESVGNYFEVVTADLNSITDAASLNCVGVVDSDGKEIIPLKYASINKINDRYFRVCEVTEQTDNKDEALVYYTDKIFSLGASEGDTLFKGKWYVYDMTTGKKLDGVTGTNKYSVYAYGDWVKYVTDNKEQITVNHKGEKLPEEAELFDNGCYAIENDTIGTVYDSNGKKMFEYSADGFAPSYITEKYYIATKYSDGSRKYVLMDAQGKVVSAEFTDMPTVYGDLVYTDDMVLNFAGEKIIDGTFEYVYFDKHIGYTWFLKNDDAYILIKKDGTVLWQGVEDDSMNVSVYDYFTISKKIDDKNMYYCLASKGFTLEGSSLAPWLIKAPAENNKYDVVDTISGNTIISGYKHYYAADVPGSAIYVYAAKDDGGLDIYLVK